MRTPLRVSVIIPNYNHARYLPQRIESVLGQTAGDFEVIVLDDASTDDSIGVIERYLDDRRVRLIRNPVNSGCTFVQWNRGVAEAAGELVWIAESDDYAHPAFLERMVAALEERPKAVVAYCQSLVVDAEDRVLESMAEWTADLGSDRWERDYVNRGPDECARYLIRKCTIPNASAVVFRKKAFLDAGGAAERMRTGDWLTWARMLLQGDVAFVAQPMNFFRRHAGSVRSLTNRLQAIRERYEIGASIARSVTVDGDLLESLRSRWAAEWADAVWTTEAPMGVVPDGADLASAERFDPSVRSRMRCLRISRLMARYVGAQAPVRIWRGLLRRMGMARGVRA